MCAAGGGDSKLYRLRFPRNPDKVVRGSGESFVFNDIALSFIDDTIVGYPFFAIPQLHDCSDLFYRDEADIR
jgi:hypothetical protein